MPINNKQSQQSWMPTHTPLLTFSPRIDLEHIMLQVGIHHRNSGRRNGQHASIHAEGNPRPLILCKQRIRWSARAMSRTIAAVPSGSHHRQRYSPSRHAQRRFKAVQQPLMFCDVKSWYDNRQAKRRPTHIVNTY